MTYEAELIALEYDFWHKNVLAREPPPYTESGDLILESLRRRLGPEFTKAQSIRIKRYLELQEEKNQQEIAVKKFDAELQRLKALILADMGNSCSARSEDGYTVTWRPVRKVGISKDKLERMKEVHPDIYAEYATVSESRRFNIKAPKADAA